jgi:hypothetical protein
MKNLQEIIDQKIINEGYTKTLIYNELGRSASSFEYALNKMSFSLLEFEKISKILNLEPNYFFEWPNSSSQNLVNEPKSSSRIIKKDTVAVSGGEVEFLRGQIDFLNAQIGKLTDAIGKMADSK